MRNIILLITLLVLCVSTRVLSVSTKCCTPDKWEGELYLEVNQIAYFIQANATAKAAYDYTNLRTFLNITGVQHSPLFDPKTQNVSVMYIEDYKNEVEYEIDDQMTCQKSYMPGFTMTKQCIYESDKLLSSGIVGGDILTDTYNVSLNEDLNNIRATIKRDSCLPLHMVYINADMGSISGLDVYNISPGIKNVTIFDVPSQCKHIDAQQRNQKDMENPLRSVLRGIFRKRMFLGEITPTK